MAASGCPNPTPATSSDPPQSPAPPSGVPPAPPYFHLRIQSPDPSKPQIRASSPEASVESPAGTGTDGQLEVSNPESLAGAVETGLGDSAEPSVGGLEIGGGDLSKPGGFGEVEVEVPESAGEVLEGGRSERAVVGSAVRSGAPSPRLVREDRKPGADAELNVGMRNTEVAGLGDDRSVMAVENGTDGVKIGLEGPSSVAACVDGENPLKDGEDPDSVPSCLGRNDQDLTGSDYNPHVVVESSHVGDDRLSVGSDEGREIHVCPDDSKLPDNENLKSHVNVIDDGDGQPDDLGSDEAKDKDVKTAVSVNRMETNGEPFSTDVKMGTEANVGPGATETLETGEDGSKQLSVVEEMQKTEYVTEETATIQHEYRPSYSLPVDEKRGFSVSDMIWGKVKSHPWWPGQIFDPSNASELASKYKKKDGLLVAYFGDGTFAWCEESQLKPFQGQFKQLEKQSAMDGFVHAVNCALDEVSRRVESGLTCSCMPEEVIAKVKHQKISNTGIREGASGASGADVSMFEAGRLLEYMKELAQLPLGGGERLELVIAKAQLASFYHSKGYMELPTFQFHGGIVDNDLEFSVEIIPSKDSAELGNPSSAKELATPNLPSGEQTMKKRGRGRPPKKESQISGGGTLCKRKHESLSQEKNAKTIADLANPVSVEGYTPPAAGLGSGEQKKKRGRPRKYPCPEGSVLHERKHKSLAVLMSERKSSVVEKNGKSSTGGNATELAGMQSCRMKRKAADSFSDESLQRRSKRLSSSSKTECETPSARKSYIVGDCISRVAGQLTGSSPILKSGDERLQNNAVKGDPGGDKPVHVSGSHTPREGHTGSHKQYSSPDVLLSQLGLAAQDPMQRHSFVSSIVGFFTGFRNSIHQENSGSGKKTSSGKNDSTKSSNLKINSAEPLEVDHLKDSYWTDRIIQGSSEEELPKECRKRKRKSQLEGSKKKDSHTEEGLPNESRKRKRLSQIEVSKMKESHVEEQPEVLQSSPKLESDQKPQVTQNINGEQDSDQKSQVAESAKGMGDSFPTELILNFNASCSVPSETDLSKIFSQYGPLKESLVIRNSNRAKVVFNRRADAELAFSSAGKFSIFGPALISYRLRYLPPKRTPSHASKQSKKDVRSIKNTMAPQVLANDTSGQTEDDLEAPASTAAQEDSGKW